LQALRTSALFEHVDLQTQRILTSLIDSQSMSNQQVITAVAQMTSRLEEAGQEAHQQTQNLLVKYLDSHKVMEVTAGIEMLAVSPAEETALRNDVQTAIINNLRYPTMTNRYEDIGDAFPQTLEWAFQESTDKHRPRANLADWLKNGTGIYWVNGKPGSGKSTLMKHLFGDRRTRQYLQHWAKTTEPSDIPLHIATFFFWNSGTAEQKSQSGLLRALLHQILDKTPDLIPIVFPYLWADTYSKYLDRQNRHSDSSMVAQGWALRDLKFAIEMLAKQRSIPIKLFFLIDGLDEFGGDHEDLMVMFRELSHLSEGRLRICLSSRPWVVFEDNLHMCTSLKMQNLTYNDIEIYVNKRLHSNSAFQRLAADEIEATSELIKEIVQKADGVFLWVRIVVKSLLSGIRNRDDMSDLWKRLRLLPKELEPLYEHLLGLIEPLYLGWVSKVLRILQASRGIDDTTKKTDGYLPSSMKERGALTLIVLYLSIDDTLNLKEIRKMLPESIEAKCNTLAVQLTARCAGFLETSASENQEKPGPTSCVMFLHRTARDFLEDRERWAALQALTLNTSFDPLYTLAKGCSLSIVLSWYLRGEGHTYLVMQEIWLMARDALVYTHEAALREVSLNSLSRILDEMGKVVSWDEVGRQKWTYRLIHNVDHTTPILSFLDLAALYGLSEHVLVRIPKLSPSELNSLLRLLLSGIASSVPSPSTSIVSSLLSHGAILDPGMKNNKVLQAIKRLDKTPKRVVYNNDQDSDYAKDGDSDDSDDLDDEFDDFDDTANIGYARDTDHADTFDDIDEGNDNIDEGNGELCMEADYELPSKKRRKVC